MNADERRFIINFLAGKSRNINNELVLTDTNSGYSEFVRVRISSLSMFMNSGYRI